MDIIIATVVLLILGYVAGNAAEKRHYASIRRRESELHHIPLVNFSANQPLPEAREIEFFVGSTVVATDFFKSFLLGLRNLVGGRVIAYESLIDRARRESLLRLKEQAVAWGATEILNVRLETSAVNNGGDGAASIEVIAYGTGIR
ncbi:MAG: YbjQ family protein [Spirulinaceae cyanobacterium SM2_1_0]|nr:YbjQ family protein [Spirulinaceae cyanobacterium SM2_1_0]